MIETDNFKKGNYFICSTMHEQTIYLHGMKEVETSNSVMTLSMNYDSMLNELIKEIWTTIRIWLKQ